MPKFESMGFRKVQPEAAFPKLPEAAESGQEPPWEKVHKKEWEELGLTQEDRAFVREKNAKNVLEIRKMLGHSDSPSGTENPYDGLSEEEAAYVASTLQFELENKLKSNEDFLNNVKKPKPYVETVSKQEKEDMEEFLKKRSDFIVLAIDDLIVEWNVKLYGWKGYKGDEAWEKYSEHLEQQLGNE